MTKMNRTERLKQASQSRRAGQIAPIMPGSPVAKKLESATRLRQAGQLAQALVQLESAVALDKTNPRCLLELANLQRAMDEPSKAVINLRKALGSAPKNPQLAANLGATLRDLSQLEEALRAFEKAVEWKPDFHLALNEVGVTQEMLGRPQEALDAFQRSIAMDKRQPQTYVSIGLVQLELGNAQAALEAGEACHKIDPRVGSSMMIRAYAMNELGRAEEARALMDLDSLVVPIELDEFEGFANAGKFNEALVRALVTHPSLKKEPNQRTTRGGLQTGELNRDESGPIHEMQQVLDRSVKRYLDELPSNPDHPYLCSRPKTWRISFWGTILDEQGHQEPHIHPQAWVSGAYYAQLPDSTKAASEERPGWIEFGRPPANFKLEKEFPTRTLQPKEGTLVLFPSFVYHRTVPSIGETQRVSVAVAAVPLT